MAHKLVVGQTLSGKSTLVKAMASEAVKRGLVLVVYDPTLSPDWETELVTDDEETFYDMLKAIHAEGAQAMVVVDEADTILGMSHRHNWWLFQRGRHFGFECVAITQRPQLVAPSIRCNAPELFIFQSGKNDAAFLGEDYGVDLSSAPELVQGSFLWAHWREGKKVVDKRKIF